MILLQVLGIAVVDSLNPTSVVIQMLLLARADAVRLSAAFIGAVFATYLGFGMLLVGGGDFLLSDAFWQRFSNRPAYMVEGVVALLIVWSAARGLVAGSQRGADEDAQTALRARQAGSIWQAAALGAVATGTDLPTALPYFAAIDCIVKAGADGLGTVLLLVAYNGTFVLPLVVLLGIYLAAADRFRPWLDRHGPAIQRGVVAASLWLLVAVGLTLVVDAACFLRVGVPLIP